MKEYSVSELKKKKTLAVGQDANLKVDNGTLRYWLSRCGPEDGAEYPVTVEKLEKGRWVVVHQYGSWSI